jgi:hypothetical protein
VQATLNESIDANLLAKPLAAANGLEDIIQRREARLEFLGGHLRRLEVQIAEAEAEAMH